MGSSSNPKGPKGHIVGTLDDEMILATELRGIFRHLPGELLDDDDLTDADKLVADGFHFFNHCPHCGAKLDPDAMMDGNNLHCPPRDS